MSGRTGDESQGVSADDSSCDVPISEGPVNLSWGAIMKTINDDPYEFFANGGWDFLTGAGDDSDDQSSSEGSVFEGESDFGSESSGSDDDSSDCELLLGLRLTSANDSRRRRLGRQRLVR